MIAPRHPDLPEQTNQPQLTCPEYVPGYAEVVRVKSLLQNMDLYVRNNALTDIDVSHNRQLQLLWYDDNKLTRLDVGGNAELSSLGCGNNQLTSVDVSKTASWNP